MRVALGTIEVDDMTRRAIREYYGKPGLATREDVRDLYRGCADADLQEITHDYMERAKIEGKE